MCQGVNMSAQTLAVFLLASLVVSSQAEICEETQCEYNFVVYRRQTMTYATNKGTYGVTYNGTNFIVASNDYKFPTFDDVIGSVVDASDVLSADGFVRDVIVINGEFPGPTIEVMAGSDVVVHVTNHLPTEALSIHWHGMHQKGSNIMDGAAYITQCPIQPLEKFTYRFKAEPSGTHWYHSHIGNQRQDGLFGQLIIHERKPDIPNYSMIFTDWYHESASSIDTNTPYGIRYKGTANLFSFSDKRPYSIDGTEVTPLTYVSTLVDGKGRWANESIPLEQYNVIPGQNYRFRITSAAAEVTYEIHIDSHVISVVASDGHEISPIEVTSIIMFPGETMDVVLTADQVEDRYWIRVQTIREGNGQRPQPDGIHHEGLAVLAYESVAQEQSDPRTTRRNCTQENPCVVFNCPFQSYLASKYRRCVHLSEARSLYSSSLLRDQFGVGLDDDQTEEMFFNFAFVIGSSINAKKFVQPRKPLVQGDLDNYVIECESDSCQSGCKCTNILDLPYNKTIQMVIFSIEPASTYLAHHSIHIHGFSFAVLAMGFGKLDETTGFREEANSDILCNDGTLCDNARWNGRRPQLNHNNPPVKDTIIIPADGYAVIRFRTDNPGHWLFHCHQILHFVEGMAMSLNVAPEMHAPILENFPKCGDFEMTDDEFAQYRAFRGRTSTTTAASTPTPTSSPQSELEDHPKFLIESDNTVIIDIGPAVGAAIGFILLGVILTLLPVILMTCFRRTDKMALD